MRSFCATVYKQFFPPNFSFSSCKEIGLSCLFCEFPVYWPQNSECNICSVVLQKQMDPVILSHTHWILENNLQLMQRNLMNGTWKFGPPVSVTVAVCVCTDCQSRVIEDKCWFLCSVLAQHHTCHLKLFHSLVFHLTQDILLQNM